MRKRYKLSINKTAILIAAVITAAIFVLNGCSESPTQKAGREVTEGGDLSKKYCVSCHQYPEPALLDKRTWERGVLPAMAGKLGLQQEMGAYYMDAHSQINLEDWRKINAFYHTLAPQKLTLPKRTAVHDWGIFELVRPAVVDTTHGPAMTSMVKFNPYDHLIYTGLGNDVYSWDSKLKGTLVRSLPSPVTAANFFKTNDGKNAAVFTCIGVLPPNDLLKGSMQQVMLGSKDPAMRLVTDSLPRPVQTATGDFNKDGLTDYIVCGYGNNVGGIYLVQQQPDHTFKRKVIRALPGAIQLETGDFNNDGWPDVLCLFAQADEGVWLFLNDRKGGFTTKNLLRFPPVNGTNSFQLVDMNNDGKKDIVYTCGDNNDYSSIFKPYHGVYIFTNRGDFTFRQTFFYHINGASKAMAADFDGDGDMDLAVIAFFPDFVDHPEEGFTYMEQLSPNKFKPHELPISQYGRWLTMDVADVDGDGDQDVVLGNFSIYGDRLINQKEFKPNWDLYEPVILLRNKTKHH
ncbi:FG-GAP repeat domain-containing protein [Mucilaginibacter glaciei]|uniref:VCBS repeat-containing protein n=1 Tax=Mucilaginibacter glaciei TaxID=2772109 RepID=A0A926NNH9_9SPHI|nr:VCBS repeat-containing protein [Mucilaginibacter glaciei]MBD1394416.1 VCBS repeat-containing protein [Mucilaginibacter glaciei]